MTMTQPQQEPRVALTLAAYQEKALATAEPRAFDLQYLVPGIMGEVGELFGQQAKAHWHGWPAKKLREELVSEYGDIAWMTALLLDTRGINMLHPVVPSSGPARWGRLDPMSALLAAASRLRLNYLMEKDGISETEQWLDQSAENLWRVLRDNCLHITGRDFQSVLGGNLIKLADRAARGVLRGQGDHR